MSNFDMFDKGFSISQANIFSKEEVKYNQEILAKNINTNFENLKFQKQVHGSTVREIAANSSNIFESDGMITDEAGLVLCVIVADCAAVLCYDGKEHCVGAFHAGWRGIADEITVKGIEMMHEKFGTKSENLLIYISPCAGSDTYEIGEEVAELFPNSVKKKENGKYLLDMRGEICKQLKKIHIPDRNMEYSSICTISNKNFHSFRRDKDKSGRMAAFIGLL